MKTTYFSTVLTQCSAQSREKEKEIEINFEAIYTVCFRFSKFEMIFKLFEILKIQKDFSNFSTL